MIRTDRGDRRRATALVETAIRGEHAGVGVLLLDGRGKTLGALSAPARRADAQSLPFEGIGAALRLATGLGLGPVVVHVPDGQALAQIEGRAPLAETTRSGCLSVRALMHALPGARLRPARRGRNAYAASLARAAATPQPMAEGDRAVLPLDAA